MKYIICFFFCLPLFAKTVRYDLTATKGKINLSGKKEVNFAIMLNGTIPAPILEFTEGDDAEIVLKNEIPDDELSVHWHGILLDPYMDGVPYVNTPPIYPGESFTFRFKIRQHGTYWYHSHTNVQEQKGVYGPIVIHPKKRTINYDKDLVVVLSDWSDEDAKEILKNLRKDGDYYLYKKGTIRSWWGAIKAGAFSNFLYNEWTRMGGMDFSDVGYDTFLINGKKDSQGVVAHPGEKVRLRIINTAASSYFNISLADVPMKIISMDGVDISPKHSNDFLIGMAETYDVLFTIPEHKNYELKATSQDGTGSASIWIGMGEKIHAQKMPPPDLYARMDHEKHEEHEKHQEHSSPKSHEPTTDLSEHQHHSPIPKDEVQDVITGFDISDAKALDKTEFPKDIPVHNVKLVLDGDMERYVWLINNKAIHEERTLQIKPNEVIRYTFENKTMMHHPFHLHGHFFRVINKHGEYSPLKHTVDVPPHSSQTIEFYSNEPGEWMLHCHNLYHLKTGMARVVKYSSFTPSSKIQRYQKEDPHLHDHTYYRGMLEASTIHAQAKINVMNTWNEVEARAEFRNDFNWEGEGDLFYKRWFNRFFNLMAGGTSVRGENAVVAGFGYKLPFLVHSQSLIDQKGRLRLDLEKRFQWTKYIFTDVDFTFRQKQESEFEITLMYQKSWNWSAGLMFTEHSAGVGLHYNF